MESSTPPPPPSTPPVSRDLRKPYFLLRTPNRLDTFLDRDNARIFLAAQEPLSCFLAPAKLIKSDDGKERVEYDFSSFDLSACAPMEHLPNALLRDLEQAIEAFYRRAGGSVSGHEREIRMALRLPDPDVEPDAYWVYGPRHDRRLLILWGCEKKQGTSLPLRSETGDPSLLEKLSARRMDWRGRQKEALALLGEKPHVLSRFVAQTLADRRGEPTGFLHLGKKVPLAKAPQAKNLRVPAKEITAFADAVEAYHLAAEDEEEGFPGDTEAAEEVISGYEKELRRSFKLPDPRVYPEAYRSHNGSFFVALSGKEREEESLFPAPSDALGLPPSELDAQGQTVVPDTVLDLLRPKQLWPKVAALAAVAVLLLSVGLLWWSSVPRGEPQVVALVAENDPQLIKVEFDLPVEFVLSDEEGGGFRVLGPDGAITPARVLAHEPAHILRLGVEPMTEGADHRLLLPPGVAANPRRTPIGAQEVPFRFLDTLPPELLVVSAGASGNQEVILVFNEPLDRNSVQRDRFSIEGFNITEARLLEGDPTRVRLVTTSRFNHGSTYALTVRDLRDASSRNNALTEPIRREFRYLDRIPPAVQDVSAVESQIAVIVRFTKEVDPATSQNTEFYRIESAGGEVIPVRSAARLAAGNAVRLTTGALQSGVAYRLSVGPVRDQADPPNTLVPAEPLEFFFRGTPITTPPAIAEILVPRQDADDGLLRNLAAHWGVSPVSLVNRFVVLRFDRLLPPEEVTRPERYALSVATSRVEVAEVLDESEGRTRVALRLDRPVPPATIFHVRVSDVKDWVGNQIEGQTRSPDAMTSGFRQLGRILRLESAVVESPTSIRLTFNADLLDRTATRPENFWITGGTRILHAEIGASPSEVVLTLDAGTPLAAGDYEVSAAEQILARRTGEVQHEVTAQFTVR